MLAAIGLALYTAWDLTLVILGAIPLGIAALAFLSKRIQPFIRSQAKDLALAAKLTTAAINAIDTVKCCNGQSFEHGQYLQVIRKAAKEYLSQAKISSLQISCIRFLTLTIFVQGFWYGSHLVENRAKTSGQILTAFWACLMATQTFEELLPQAIVLEKGRNAAATLHAILENIDNAQKLESMLGHKSPSYCDGDIQFSNVSRLSWKFTTEHN